MASVISWDERSLTGRLTMPAWQNRQPRVQREQRRLRGHANHGERDDRPDDDGVIGALGGPRQVDGAGVPVREGDREQEEQRAGHGNEEVAQGGCGRSRCRVAAPIRITSPLSMM